MGSPAAGVRAVPRDPWCPAPPASEVRNLRASYLRSDPTARTRPMSHRLLLVGDSTACTLLPGLVALGPFYGTEVENAAVVACGVVSDRVAPLVVHGVDLNSPSRLCHAKVAAVESSGLVHGMPDIVLWSSAWEKDGILLQEDGRDVVAQPGSGAWTRTLERRIDQRIALFTGAGANVVLLEQPPFVDLGKVNGLTVDDRDFLKMNALLGAVAAAHDGRVAAVDLSQRVCPTGPPCPILVSGVWVRGDGAHYMASGALWTARWLFPRILRAIQS